MQETMETVSYLDLYLVADFVFFIVHIWLLKVIHAFEKKLII